MLVAATAASITLLHGSQLVLGLRAALPRHALVRCQGHESWSERLAELSKYAESYGNANAPLGTELGRWCNAQRRLHASGKLSEARSSALEKLGFSWSSPSDVNDPVAELDWEEMCSRFANYRTQHGDGQVPKKYKLDPALGGWVAAVRRCRNSLGDARVAQLDEIGFEWVSTRQCGSAFMQTFREVREFYDAYGHTDVASVLGDGHDLARWCDAQRAAGRKGLLAEKRVAYLDGIRFDWQ